MAQVRCARYCSLLLAFLSIQLFARDHAVEPQPPSVAHPTVVIPRLDHAPKLEDFLGMKPGPNAPRMAAVTNFIQLAPKDGAPAQEKTVAYIGYDQKNFYAIFVCFDDQPGKIRARMARREDIGPEHDEVQVYFDTFNDRRRSYGFMINPVGIQFDYIWTDDNGYDASWDAVWDSWGKVTPQGYVGMMSIPFKSLRFPDRPEQTWGIVFQRVIPHNNDNSFYPHISASVQGRLSQEAELQGLKGITPGRNIQLNPYGVVDGFRNLDQRNPDFPFYNHSHLSADAGLDGKMVIHDSLVFDFTVNPDFRQLESDQPQNLINQRFEVFFPEKRPFFQEGANFFNTPVNLYFTRRIADPQYGVRLYGKLADDYSLGLLAVDDQSPGRVVPDDDPLRRKRAYFTVGRFARELPNRSQIGVFYSDREMSAVAPDKTLCDDTAVTTTEEIACITNSNRVGGVDATIRLGQHFQSYWQFITSQNNEADGTHLAGNMYHYFAEYSTRHWDLQSAYNDIGNGFVTLTGFFQRPDFRDERQFVRYLWKPEGKIVTDYGPQLFTHTSFDHEGNRLIWDYEPGFNLDLKANTNIQVWHGFQREQLRPADFSQLTHNVDFPENYTGVFINNTYFKFVTFNGVFITDTSPNFSPPGVQAPFLTRETQINFDATLHPFNPLTIQNDYILERLRTETNPALGIISGHVIRSKWNYQYNPRLGFRTIFQYDADLVNPFFTSDDKVKNFNTDFLITYLIHPGTAFYLGYNSNMENLDPEAITHHLGLFRTGKSYINDGRTIFGKVSWLFRF